MANLIILSWLKDKKVHVEDQNMPERKGIQLVKDFHAKCTHDKLESHMGMVAEDQHTFNGPVNHLKSAFQLRDTISELIRNFWI